jgi:uncharacterized protein (DUF302 family)
MTELPPPALVEHASPFDVATTLQRLTAAIEAAGLTIFARIDHAEGARQAGLEMPPAVVLIYGHAKGGTPIMLSAPRVALDLPLRVLVRESQAGTVVSWHSMAPVLLAAGAPPALANRLDGAQNLLLKALQP